MEQFRREVLLGLSQSPKKLSSKYFYDKEGDNLFQAIMNCPEYYLAASEMEIFRTRTKELALTLKNGFNTFNLIELGAGDATKSIHLLRELSAMGVDFTYLPIDISAAMIEHLEDTLPKKVEGLKVKGLNGDYFTMLEKAGEISSRKKVVLFLGGNIGNESPDKALHLCRKIRAGLEQGDRILVGFDLKKDPHKILAAYNDAAGYTARFNLNLLRRINAELGGNFDLAKYVHYPTYDPLTGACKSFLVSRVDQVVSIAEKAFAFQKDECIFMEISQKYTIEETACMAARSGFIPVKNFFDRRKWFVDTVWECS